MTEIEGWESLPTDQIMALGDLQALEERNASIEAQIEALNARPSGSDGPVASQTAQEAVPEGRTTQGPQRNCPVARCGRS